MKYSLLKKTLLNDLEAGLVPFVEGPPGCGKSALSEDIAKEGGYEYIPFILSVAEPTDISGFPKIGENEAHFVPVQPLARIFSTDKKILCVFDDFGQASTGCQAATMQLIHGGRLNGHTVGANVRFMLCSNRFTDRAGVNRIISPIRGRVVSRNFDFDLNDWCLWALDNGVNTMPIAFARFRPGCFSDFEDMGREDKPFCSARALDYLSKNENQGIDPECAYEIICGDIGERYGAEYAAFRKIYLSLPNPDAVIMAPETATVPDDPATLYAICGALARKATENTIDRLCIYANRLPEEFSVLLISDCARRCPAIVNTRGFIEWFSKHSDVLL